MKKNNIIVFSLIIIVLAAAFWWGGNSPALHGWNVNDNFEQTDGQENKKDENLLSSAKPDVQANENENLKTEPPQKDTESAKDEKKDLPQKTVEVKKSEPQKTDKYHTDPVPSGKPQPVEPENANVNNNEKSCTLSVTCKTILDNMDMLDPLKYDLVPEDGVIFKETTVHFYEGESVFNVLQRELKKAKIHMEFTDTPMYNSAYIEGINNIYEFDCGEGSGWMYRVNGWFPNYGCSRYQLKDGDKIEWIYTCSLGKDIGAYVSENEKNE